MLLKLKFKNINLNTTPFFIAEIGFNFSNNINLAKEMITAAKENGADAVKFQSFKADSLLLQSEAAYNIIKENELSNEAHIELKQFSEKLKIDFFSTPFDIQTLKFLITKLKIKLIKIASGDMDFFPLLETSAKSKLPVILSTGFSDFNEITKSVNFIKKYNKQLILLHCVANYPLQPKDANLKVISKLIKKYACPVGFSDHSLGGHLCCAAAALGARVFEKHFTINRKLGTIDNPISMEPQEFKKMVNEINDIVKALGTGEKNQAVLTKESQIKKFARRSIFASAQIKKGEIFSDKNIKIVRPFIEKANRPLDYYKLIGKISAKNYNKNDFITGE